MAIRNEKAYRLFYAAIAGSAMTSREIRRLVDDLSVNGELVRMLQDGLWRLCDDLDNKFGRLSKAESNYMGTDEYMTDLLMSHVNSKRISKEKLRLLMDQSSKRMGGLIDPSKLTLRAMISSFLEKAEPREVSVLMSSLDIDSSEDLYLGGIDRKSRGMR